MAETYREYLAARVLTESRPVTYRLLSRAQQVNVNLAKQMLYDFYTKQNAKQPKSLHATYLLTGRKRDSEHMNGVNGVNGNNGRDGDDIIMHSSPYMSSMPEPEEPKEEPVPQTSIMLVREEELEETKAEFEEITSIHIYSLEPGPIEDLNVLSVCNQEVAKEHANDDPLDRWRRYGSIHNPYIKRRTARFAPAPAPAAPKPAPKVVAKSEASAPSKEKEKTAQAGRGNASEANTSGRPAPQPAPAAGALKKSDSKSNLKREKSDLFKSFAKARPKAKQVEKSAPSPAEDEPMQGMSEDEADGDDEPEVKIDEEKAAEARRVRAERDRELREMMDKDYEEEMPDAPGAEEKDSQEAAVESAPSTNPADGEGTVTVQGGRRRGRRKVTKKKTVKDEEGYLVTKEEAHWESFSEDEPEPKKLKPAPKPAASTAKGKKTGKQGQGSIANFFKKA